MIGWFRRLCAPPQWQSRWGARSRTSQHPFRFLHPPGTEDQPPVPQEVVGADIPLQRENQPPNQRCHHHRLPDYFHRPYHRRHPLQPPPTATTPSPGKVEGFTFLANRIRVARVYCDTILRFLPGHRDALPSLTQIGQSIAYMHENCKPGFKSQTHVWGWGQGLGAGDQVLSRRPRTVVPAVLSRYSSSPV